MTECDLVKQVVAGASAFGQLVTLYRPALVVFCARRVGGEDAEEVAQDALLKAWQSVSQCKELRKFKSWVWVIARNECNRRLRARKDTVSLDDMAEVGVGDVVLDEVLTEEGLRVILEAVETLPEKQKECVRLLIGKTNDKEIAGALGMTPGATRTLICRTRAAVTKALRNGSIE